MSPEILSMDVVFVCVVVLVPTLLPRHLSTRQKSLFLFKGLSIRNPFKCLYLFAVGSGCDCWTMFLRDPLQLKDR